MKQYVIKGIQKNVLLIIALIAFVIFSGNKKLGAGKDVAGRCCTGYSITTDKLKKFMLDSLHGDQYEGGVYSKSKLLAAINKIPGDSVYLINTLLNCSVANGTDLALTSPTANGVYWVGKPGCNPCPGKPCCTPKVCVTRIDRGCVNYTTYHGLTDAPALISNASN